MITTIGRKEEEEEEEEEVENMTGESERWISGGL